MLRTDSINEAAYVVARGMSHPEFDWINDNLCLFVFKDCDKAGRLINEYKEGGKVVAHTYAVAIATLKSSMFKSKK